MLEREQKLVEEEKTCTEHWIGDLKSGFELEKQSWQEKISQLEGNLKTAESRDPARTTAHVPLEGKRTADSGMGERSTNDSSEAPPTDPPATSEASREATGKLSGTDTSTSGDRSTPATGDTSSTSTSSAKATETSSSDELMKSVTELIKVQMQAMTKAVSVQSLPPKDTYTDEGSQAEDDGIDRWLERFDERAHLAEWSDEVKLYQLKVHLNKTALHVFRIFSTEEKSSYKNTADALRKRFHPVDIEELRGLEFHRKVQEDESVEQLGLKLQRLGRRAFPTLNAKTLIAY